MEGYKRVAVVGASGLLGKPLVRQLAKAGFDLTLLSRDSTKLRDTFRDVGGVKFKEVEPNDEEGLIEALTGVEAIVSVVGSLALPSQISYIDAAIKAGVKRFIPSEFGCDTQAPYLSGELIFGQKRGVALYLKELAALNKITYTLIPTGLFFTLDLPFPLAGIDYKAGKADIVGTGEELFSLTHLDDIGRYVAAVLARPEETKNKVIRVAGDTQSAHSILSKFEKRIGKKFKVNYQNAVVMRALLKKAIDHKKYNVYFTNAIPCFTGDGRAQLDRPTEGYPNQLDNDMFPEVKPLTADDIIEELRVIIEYATK